MRSFATNLPISILSGIVFINGCIAVLTSFITYFPGKIQSLLPVHYWYFHAPLHIFLGFLLMYFSLQLLQRKLLAWWISFLSTCLIVLSTTFHGLPFLSLIIPLGTLMLLVRYQEQFRVKGDIQNIREGTIFLLISCLLALVYGTLGFYLLDKKDFGIDFSLIDAFVRVLREYTLIGNDDLIAHTRHAEWFLISLDVLGVLGSGFGILSIFRPLQYRYQTLPHERQAVEDILKTWSTTPEDYFKLWPIDKSYVFSDNLESVIAYKTAKGTAIGCGDPVGNPKSFAPLVHRFNALCETNGWLPAHINCTEHVLPLLKTTGYELIKIGENALVDLETFQTKTIRKKYFRNLKNRFTTQKFQTGWLALPLTSAQVAHLKKISDSWLHLPGKREQGFAMGYFSPSHIKHCDIFVLKDSTGRICAFTTMIPSSPRSIKSNDLMRFHSNAPKGSMDYLLMQLFLDLKAQGYQTFDLGLAPLSGEYEATNTSLTGKMIKTLFDTDLPIFPYKGLRLFKHKFDPLWENRYVAYKSGPGNFLKTLMSLQQAFEID